jgi:peptidase M28-like protein
MPHHDVIARLVGFEGRAAGTAAERDAAEYLAQELRAAGREAEVEDIRVRPAYHLTLALHCALAVLGSVVAVNSPALGVVVLLLIATSMFGDLTGRFHLLRLLTPRRPSQNVTSPGSRADAPARLVLTAHYDAARSGLIFARTRRAAPRPLRALSRLGSRIDVFFWAVVVVLVIAVLRLIAGITSDESTVLTVIQFVPTVLLIVGVLLFMDVALSDPVPGANDNASGVAAVFELARRLTEHPPHHLDVWLVLTGANEGLMLGMREWMRAHSDDIDPRRTFFVNLDSVGRGEVGYVKAEGFVVIEQHDARLVRLCESIGTGKPEVLRFGTDAVIPTMRRFSSITICCTDPYGRIPDRHRQSDTAEKIEPQAVTAAVEFAHKLVHRIDAELLPSQLARLQPAGRSA